MARPKSEELYRKKGSHNWVFYRKGFGTIDTGTTDRFKAEQIYKNMAPKTQVPEVLASEPVEPIREALDRLADSLPMQPQEPRPITQEDFGKPVPNANDWQSQMPVERAEAPRPAHSFEPLKPAEGSQPLSQSARDVASDTRYQALQQIKSKLTPAKRAKFMGILAGGAAKINALAAEYALQMGKRKLPDDFILSDDDLEILKTGYEMGLDKLLENADPEWWHLVIMGNITLLAVMIPASQKLEKIEPPKADEGASDGS